MSDNTSYNLSKQIAFNAFQAFIISVIFIFGKWEYIVQLFKYVVNLNFNIWFIILNVIALYLILSSVQINVQVNISYSFIPLHLKKNMN